MSTELLEPLARVARDPHGGPQDRPGTTLDYIPAAHAPVAGVRGVHRRWRLGRTEVHALRGVDLDVFPGELLAICGPSGSGKTTLLNLLGLIDRPDQGEVLLGGRAVQTLPEGERAVLRNRHLGFVFQSFNLVPVLDALENVLLPLQIAGRVGAAERARAGELLDAVGLAAQMKQRPDRMSGGQRQRVAVARALVTRPRLVLADEPTANLDGESTAQVMQVIKELNRATGATFVFSTHDERVVAHMHRRVMLRDGRVQTETPGVAA